MKPFKCMTCSREISDMDYSTIFSHNSKEVWHICADCSTNVLRFDFSAGRRTRLVSSKTVRGNGKKHILEVWELSN